MAPLELCHIDHMSIEMTIGLYQSPKVVNILVFQDHFARHIVAYVTPNQTAKMVAEFLYQGCTLTSGASANLLRDLRMNFMSNIIQELCGLIRIKKIRILPYHGQTNGQGECVHQTIMWMIGKLGKYQMTNWLNHLSDVASLQLHGISYGGVWPMLSNIWVINKNASCLLLSNHENSTEAQAC